MTTPISRTSNIIARNILRSLVHNRGTLTFTEACDAGGKLAYGKLALKADQDCYLFLGASAYFRDAINYLVQTEQVVLRKARPELYGSSAPHLPVVSDVGPCLRASWLPLTLNLS